MRKLFRIGLMVISSLVVLGGFASKGNADENRSDHALFFTGSTPPDTAIYCGVRQEGKKGKAYTLHISGTASDADGTFVITFLDEDPMGFLVPQGSTYSTTHALGGVPTVDTTVRITATGGVHSIMASVLAEEGAKDPFVGDGEKDNFCVTINASGTDNNGLTIKLATPHPASWDDAFGNLK